MRALLRLHARTHTRTQAPAVALSGFWCCGSPGGRQVIDWRGEQLGCAPVRAAPGCQSGFWRSSGWELSRRSASAASLRAGWRKTTMRNGDASRENCGGVERPRTLAPPRLRFEGFDLRNQEVRKRTEAHLDDFPRLMSARSLSRDRRGNQPTPRDKQGNEQLLTTAELTNSAPRPVPLS